jgi:hypothetical protein
MQGAALAAEKKIPTENGKFVVVVDHDSLSEIQRNHLFAGLKRSFRHHGIDAADVLIYQLTKPSQLVALYNSKKLQKHLSLMWIRSEWLSELEKIQSQNPHAIVLLNQKLPSQIRGVVSSHPSTRDLGKLLSSALHANGIASVAVMQSQQHLDEAFVQGFSEAYTAWGGKIVGLERYHSGRVTEVVATLKKLLSHSVVFLPETPQISEPAGPLTPESSGTNTQSLPGTKLDGLLILDDFRMVRHIVKIYRSLTRDRLIFLGNHLWRSTTLIEPREPYLDGAMFVDFIGRYDEIPIQVQDSDISLDKMSIDPMWVDAFDFGLFAERGIKTALDIRNFTRGLGQVTGSRLLKATSQVLPPEVGKLIRVERGRLMLGKI